MRALTEIEVQYVSGGNGKPPAPQPKDGPTSSNDGPSWLEVVTGGLAGIVTRTQEMIAGVAEDIGAGLRAVTDKGPETEKFSWSEGYSRTSCATGQELDGDKCTYPDKPKDKPKSKGD
jgi:hypothetical protein